MPVKVWGEEYHREAQRLAAQGVKVRDIGKAIGVPFQTVARWDDVKLQRNVSIAMVVGRDEGGPLSDEDKRAIVLFGMAGKTTEELAEKYKTSAAVIRKHRYGHNEIADDVRREVLIDAGDIVSGGFKQVIERTLAAPIHSMMQGAVALEKMTKALKDLHEVLGERVGAGQGKKDAMDLLALWREELRQREAAGPIIEARIVEERPAWADLGFAAPDDHYNS